MGILSNWGRHLQRWSSTQPQREYINSDSNSIFSRKWFSWRSDNNRSSDKFIRHTRLRQQWNLHNNNTRRGISIYPTLSRAWYNQPDRHTKSDRSKIRHRYNKRLYPIALCLTQLAIAPATLAEGVGGVSATANPIANSSGSVTNQAIQVLQGPYVTNTYGGGVSCQGTTLNMTPYIQFADSRKDPWEDFYNEPQYNMSDFSGRTTKQTVTVKNYPWESWYDDRTKADGSRWFEDGDDIQIEIDVDGPDGVPDLVADGGEMTPTWMKPVRTDMKANQSFNIGMYATKSIPLNRGMQRKCREAAEAQIAHRVQLTSNKRLDFEIARLKNCGELKKAGIFFHPASPYHSVCADVMVTAPGGQIVPHQHDMPKPKWVDPNSSSDQLPSSSQTSEVASPSSLDTDSSGSQIKSDGTESSQESSELSQSSSSQSASQLSKEDQLGVLQVGQMSLPQQQSMP